MIPSLNRIIHKAVAKIVIVCALAGAAISVVIADPEINLIPWPKSVEAIVGQMLVTDQSRIVISDQSLAPLADILSEDIWRLTALRLEVTEGNPGVGDLSLELSSDLEGEAYIVSITDRAIIKGGIYQACAWGEVTLVQLLKNDGQISLPRVNIQDQPDTDYRGAMIDLARRWHPVDTVKDSIELLRFYKVRYLHLHLSDDQLFVFPSKSFPELASRNQSYTFEEMTDIVRFADERGVTIIPEIDVPGHASSWLGKRPDIFGSIDPVTGVAKRTDVVNMASETAYEGMDALVGDLCDMFKSSPYIHLGTDETSADSLKNLPEYMVYTENHGLTEAAAGHPHELFCHFIVRMNDIVKQHGRQMIVWGLPGSTSNVTAPTDVIDMEWNGNPVVALARGYKLINASSNPLYIVPSQGNAPTPESLYSWNSRLVNLGNSNGPTQLPATETNLIGAQLCFWEQRYNEVVPVLRPRIAALSERLWNEGAGKIFANFEARFTNVDRSVQKILYPVSIEAAGLVEPNDVRFTGKLTVNLTSELPGTIRYTLSKPWEVFPSTSSDAFANTFVLDDTMTVSARLYDADGKPVGGLTQERFSKIVPGYKYRLMGPTPISSWNQMPDFSQLTELRTGVMGLMTADRAAQINRSMFAGVSAFGHIEVRIPELWNARTLELNGQLRIPADGVYQFKVRTATGQAELTSGGIVLGSCTLPPNANVTSSTLTTGVHPFSIKYYNKGVFNDLNIQIKGPTDAEFVPFETLIIPVTNGRMPSPSRTLVTEPFDYNPGVWTQSGTDWTSNMGSGSGTGWGTNDWFSHLGSGIRFGISATGHTGSFADSTGLNYTSNSWRERRMIPVHGNNDGAVIWQYLVVSATGTGSAAQLTTQNESGGGNFAIRIMTDGTHALSAGHQNAKTTSSAIAASLDVTAPDIVVVKMKNQTGTALFDVSMWVNPTSATTSGLPAPDLQILDAAAFNNNRNIGSINWMPGQSQIDNFTLANDYQDFGIGTTVTSPLVTIKDGNMILTDNGGAPVNFGPTAEGHALVKTFTVTNGDTTDLTLGTIHLDGENVADFVVGEPVITTVAPGNSTTFTVTFTPTTAGAKTAAIHLSSDVVGDRNPFDITLIGNGLSFTTDTDGDGMSDAAEYNLAAMGFDWQVSQVARVDALFTGANSAGLYQGSQVQALQVAPPRLDRNPVTGQFKLTLAVSKSSNMDPFTPLPVTPHQAILNSNGELEFNFSSENGAALYRIETK